MDLLNVLDEDVFDVINELLEDSSDDEPLGRHGGSQPGKRPNIERGREDAAQRLYRDYFCAAPVYDSEMFERRFRLSQPIVMKISERLQQHDPYFKQKRDCTGKLGFTPLQKVTAALRLLAYGIGADAVDEILRIGESTSLECLERFAVGVLEIFGEEYLRSPTPDDLKRILARSEARGFPGCIGSIDCCKWEWKNCPTALHGQYEGKEGVPTITLEAIADETLWIWHAFFGMPGCLNDINVLDASPLFNRIASGEYPLPIRYQIAGEDRNIPYWLADGIYPEWPMFVQTVSEPTTKKEKLMAGCQEGARKDVERAFGVLQAKWHIIVRPCRLWGVDKMKSIIMCCIILHNMMVEWREASGGRSFALEPRSGATIGGDVIPLYALRRVGVTDVPPPGSISALSATTKLTGNLAEYAKTRGLVIQHLWDCFGSTTLTSF